MPKDFELTASERYMKNLEKKIEDLNSIVDIFEVISSTLNLKDLMNLVMEKAKDVTGADACSILLYNKETNKLEFEVAICKEAISSVLMERVTIDLGQGIAGWVAANQKHLIINDVTKDDRFYAGADKLTGFTTKNIAAYPLIGRRGLIGVVELINTKKMGHDADIFETLCRQFAVAIENALLHKDSIEQERVRQELKIAAEVQKSFLPPAPFFIKDMLSVSAVNIPALTIGGDIYDFIEPVEGKVGVLIGDVSGKGISAALYMAKIISEFRYAARLESSPEVVLNRLNLKLADAPRGMFFTAMYIIVDVATGKLRVSVAGHPPFLLRTKDKVSVTEVISGPPLGIMPVEYPGTDLLLREGDSIIALTDGVFDAKDRDGKRLGFERLVAFIKKHNTDGHVVKDIVTLVNDLSKGMERVDDLTIVELKWGKSD